MVCKIITPNVRAYKQLYNSNYITYAIVFSNEVNMDSFIDTYDRSYVIENMWRTTTVNNVEHFITRNGNVIRISYNTNVPMYYSIMLYRNGHLYRSGRKPNIISLSSEGLTLERYEGRLIYKYISRLGYKFYVRYIGDVEVIMKYNGAYTITFKCPNKEECVVTLYNCVDFPTLVNHLDEEKYIDICKHYSSYINNMLDIIKS